MDTFNLFTDFDYEEPNDNVFVNTVLNAVKEPPPKKSPAPKKIQDFGEKIGGARKDLYAAYRNLWLKRCRMKANLCPLPSIGPNRIILSSSKKAEWISGASMRSEPFGTMLPSIGNIPGDIA